MDYLTARDLLQHEGVTWGELRDHMLNRVFDDPDSLPSMSNVNPAVPITKAWDVYDKAIGNRDPAEKVDPQKIGDELLATNIIRDFGFPMNLPSDTSGDSGERHE